MGVPYISYVVRRRDKSTLSLDQSLVSMSFILAHDGDQLDYGKDHLPTMVQRLGCSGPMRTLVGELGFGMDHLATIRSGPVAAD